MSVVCKYSNDSDGVINIVICSVSSAKLSRVVGAEALFHDRFDTLPGLVIGYTKHFPIGPLGGGSERE